MTKISGSYEGISLDSDIDISGPLTMIVGRNASGKTRLLKGIEAKQLLLTDAPNKSLVSCKYYECRVLQPTLTINKIIPPRPGIAMNGASNITTAQFIKQYSTLFAGPKDKAISELNNVSYAPAGLNMQNFINRAYELANSLRKSPNELSPAEMSTLDVAPPTTEYGTLNVYNIFERYWRKIEDNRYALYKVKQYNAPEESAIPENQLHAMIGQPPWKLANEILATLFRGEYHFQEPPAHTFEDYSPTLMDRNGRIVNIETLSTGERMLLWLGLSQYTAHTNSGSQHFDILLLDEPDSSLHAAMIPTMLEVIEKISKSTGAKIIISTHSPTTTALATGPIYTLADSKLLSTSRDEATAELLRGVDQIAFSFSNQRHVFTESDRDAAIYRKVFSLAKKFNLIPNRAISLEFSAAATKLPEKNISQILAQVFGSKEEEKIREASSKINGLGNDTRVIATVQDLLANGNATAHGIIDWDGKNSPQKNIHVHAETKFYSIESAIANPLTIAFFLATAFVGAIPNEQLGFSEELTPYKAISAPQEWQRIADVTTMTILGIDNLNAEIGCEFRDGVSIYFDKRYVHLGGAGHPIQDAIMNRFPAVKALKEKFLMRIVDNYEVYDAKLMPLSLIKLFKAIQQ